VGLQGCQLRGELGPLFQDSPMPINAPQQSSMPAALTMAQVSSRSS
jgi:hypothetical protein